MAAAGADSSRTVGDPPPRCLDHGAMNLAGAVVDPSGRRELWQCGTPLCGVWGWWRIEPDRPEPSLFDDGGAA